MTEHQSLGVGSFLLSVSASISGTSMQNVSCVVNGVTIRPRRYYHPAHVDFAWGLA